MLMIRTALPVTMRAPLGSEAGCRDGLSRPQLSPRELPPRAWAPSGSQGCRRDAARLARPRHDAPRPAGPEALQEQKIGRKRAPTTVPQPDTLGEGRLCTSRLSAPVERVGVAHSGRPTGVSARVVQAR